MPKAQRTQGLSSAYQSWNKFKHKSWSNFIFKISTKHSLQNPNQTSASRLNLIFKILTKASIKILTKKNLHNLNQGSAAIYWLNLSFKISSELQLQNLDQTLCSKSGQKFDLMTKIQLPNLHQTIANTFLSINISNSNNLNFWVGIFTPRVISIKFTKQHKVSESVSDKGLRSDKNEEWCCLKMKKTV